jgi:hypothetical protein
MKGWRKSGREKERETEKEREREREYRDVREGEEGVEEVRGRETLGGGTTKGEK